MEMMNREDVKRVTLNVERRKRNKMQDAGCKKDRKSEAGKI